MGKSTISMAIFNSYVSLPEGIHHYPWNIWNKMLKMLNPVTKVFSWFMRSRQSNLHDFRVRHTCQSKHPNQFQVFIYPYRKCPRSCFQRCKESSLQASGWIQGQQQSLLISLQPSTHPYWTQTQSSFMIENQSHQSPVPRTSSGIPHLSGRAFWPHARPAQGMTGAITSDWNRWLPRFTKASLKGSSFLHLESSGIIWNHLEFVNKKNKRKTCKSFQKSQTHFTPRCASLVQWGKMDRLIFLDTKSA